MRISSVIALAAACQVGCTIGAPAMNDATGPSPIVGQISVARRASLPDCTQARDDLKAYIREEKLVATCDGIDWRDEAGNAVTETTTEGNATDLPASDLPAENSGTVGQ